MDNNISKKKFFTLLLVTTLSAVVSINSFAENYSASDTDQRSQDSGFYISASPKGYYVFLTEPLKDPISYGGEIAIGYNLNKNFSVGISAGALMNTDIGLNVLVKPRLLTHVDKWQIHEPAAAVEDFIKKDLVPQLIDAAITTKYRFNSKFVMLNPKLTFDINDNFSIFLNGGVGVTYNSGEYIGVIDESATKSYITDPANALQTTSSFDAPQSIDSRIKNDIKNILLAYGSTDPQVITQVQQSAAFLQQQNIETLVAAKQNVTKESIDYIKKITAKKINLNTEKHWGLAASIAIGANAELNNSISLGVECGIQYLGNYALKLDKASSEMVAKLSPYQDLALKAFASTNKPIVAATVKVNLNFQL